jgi:hypothetical protein
MRILFITFCGLKFGENVQQIVQLRHIFVAGEFRKVIFFFLMRGLYRFWPSKSFIKNIPIFLFFFFFDAGIFDANKLDDDPNQLTISSNEDT